MLTVGPQLKLRIVYFNTEQKSSYYFKIIDSTVKPVFFYCENKIHFILLTCEMMLCYLNFKN